MNINFNIVVTHESPWYVASCLENDVVSQGKSVEEAMENLREALELYYEDSSESPSESVKAFLTTMEVSIP